MPATQLDRRTALIVIDLQKGIAAFPYAHPVADIVKNAGRLAAAFRKDDIADEPPAQPARAASQSCSAVRIRG